MPPGVLLSLQDSIIISIHLAISGDLVALPSHKPLWKVAKTHHWLFAEKIKTLWGILASKGAPPPPPTPTTTLFTAPTPSFGLSLSPLLILFLLFFGVFLGALLLSIKFRSLPPCANILVDLHADLHSIRKIRTAVALRADLRSIRTVLATPGFTYSLGRILPTSHTDPLFLLVLPSIGMVRVAILGYYSIYPFSLKTSRHEERSLQLKHSHGCIALALRQVREDHLGASGTMCISSSMEQTGKGEVEVALISRGFLLCRKSEEIEKPFASIAPILTPDMPFATCSCPKSEEIEKPFASIAPILTPDMPSSGLAEAVKNKGREVKELAGSRHSMDMEDHIKKPKRLRPKGRVDVLDLRGETLSRPESSSDLIVPVKKPGTFRYTPEIRQEARRGSEIDQSLLEFELADALDPMPGLTSSNMLALYLKAKWAGEAVSDRVLGTRQDFRDYRDLSTSSGRRGRRY